MYLLVVLVVISSDFSSHLFLWCGSTANSPGLKGSCSVPFKRTLKAKVTKKSRGYNTEGHEHKMEKSDENPDQAAPPSQSPQDQAAPTTQSPGDSRRLSIQHCIQSLVHARQCRNANCSLPSCQKMKRVVQHTKGCKRKTNGGCPVCKQLVALCCYHAKHCQENKCPVPFCLNVKHKLRQQQLQHRLQQAQMLRRRMASMQRVGQPAPGGAPGGNGLPSPGANNGATGPGTPTSVGTQPPTPQTPTQGNMPALPQQQGVGMGGMGGMGTPGQQQQVQQQGGALPPQHHLHQFQPVGGGGMMSSPQQQMVPHIQQQQPNQGQGPMPGEGQQQGQQQGQGVAGAAASLPSVAGSENLSRAALQDLLRTLRSPSSPLQQQRVLNILRSNPTLMAAFICQRAARYRGGQGGPGGAGGPPQGAQMLRRRIVGRKATPKG